MAKGPPAGCSTGGVNVHECAEHVWECGGKGCARGPLQVFEECFGPPTDRPMQAAEGIVGGDGQSPRGGCWAADGP
jgi:hypothetical protein